MTLSSADLALIRDEIGAAPDDSTLHGYFTELGHTSWIPTALRVLRRRRSTLAGGGVSSVSLAGVVSVSISSSLSSIDSQISRLERQLAALDAPCGEPVSSRVSRQTYRSG